MSVRTVRLDGFVRLKSPVSHIGEIISNTSYLVEDSVLQPDGTLEKVFCYSGNAWRGQIRDLMSSYMLDALGRPRLSLDAFHLLYSGGRMGGVLGEDAIELSAGATNCTSQCQAQNRINGSLPVPPNPTNPTPIGG